MTSYNWDCQNILLAEKKWLFATTNLATVTSDRNFQTATHIMKCSFRLHAK